ncbi:MAG: putative fatty-acid--CoA ligase [Modestobacter sp.]|jgi:long-chain acyl-CoA synthetase|nr:putative fatty-acid--CoA ligase [Modestobacter sp.]MCW2510751.1 putative fatty-acid--CoA ligase [Modestobacter sp.]
MYPATFAASAPDRPAVVMAGSGEVVTYRQLDERSNRAAHLFRDLGLRPGDVVAICMENNARYHEVYWGTRRSGLYVVPLNPALTPAEAGYVLADSGARVLVMSQATAGLAAGLTPDAAPGVATRLMIGPDLPGWDSYADAVASRPVTPIDDECEGDLLQYSSGTTGRPKGIKREFRSQPISLASDPTIAFLRAIGFEEGDVYLSPAPLYHTAPIVWSSAIHRVGGTSVVMERFDAEQALSAIERHRVTHSLMVPTMFVRMLKLPAERRERWDVSSLRTVVHAAAPCPVEIKRAMIDWWGPILSEFYSSSELIGATFITTPEWLAHPGSVGRPMLGVPHVVGADGAELPTGGTGQIWFEGGRPFTYLHDETKTSEAFDARGWATVGDIGHLDEDGYLYLTDRTAFTIISGGVNIYPQEAENLLVEHPAVLDAAVFGVPHPEMGEQVQAVVQPVDWSRAGDDLEAELIEYCRSRLAGYKCPRSIDFARELPRSETGKLHKRALQQEYRSRS